MVIITNSPLAQSKNRLAFAPDGSLWVGHTHLSWAGAKGLQRIVWDGKTPFEVKCVSLKKGGLRIRFTKDIDAKSLAKLKSAKAYSYLYHEAYGSKRQNEKQVPLKAVISRSKANEIFLKFDTSKAGYVYEFNLAAIKSAKGEKLANTLMCYFMRKSL